MDKSYVAMIMITLILIDIVKICMNIDVVQSFIGIIFGLLVFITLLVNDD